MTDYRPVYLPGATWFFTVNPAERYGNRLLIEHVDALRQAFVKVPYNELNLERYRTVQPHRSRGFIAKDATIRPELC